ncbi:hypothetical protein HUU61_17875 [Rhodopseudomonas palustris]|nr:hypothetical protein [Rhodopseudomonas palustris]
MNYSLRLMAIFAILGVGFGPAFAESASPLSGRSSSTSATVEPTTQQRVERWTKAKWNEAKKELAMDKEKWSACQAKSDQQHLQGRKSWSFLYTCVKG